jgi:hypothetical protein
VIEKWRVEYNTSRPHSALGYRPPAPAACSSPWGQANQDSQPMADYYRPPFPSSCTINPLLTEFWMARAGRSAV